MNSNKINIKIDKESAKLITVLWEKKIKILLSGLLFLTLSYLYLNDNKNIQYKAQLAINKIPSSFFLPFERNICKFRNVNTSNCLQEEFNDIFIQSFLSTKFFEKFIIENNYSDEINSFLRNKGVTFSQYFFDKFSITANEKNKFIDYFILAYEHPLQLDNLLDNYVLFTKIETEKKIKKTLHSEILTLIEFAKKNLKIAQTANIIDPVLAGAPYNKIYDVQLQIFLGTKILDLEIESLEKIRSNIDKLNFDYEYFYYKTITKKTQTDFTKKLVASFIFGCLFLILIILSRNLILIKK